MVEAIKPAAAMSNITMDTDMKDHQKENTKPVEDKLTNSEVDQLIIDGLLRRLEFT